MVTNKGYSFYSLTRNARVIRLFFLLFTVSSCIDREFEGIPNDPEGTVAISMTNDTRNSATKLYLDECNPIMIDDMNNFVNVDFGWEFVELGKIDGLYNIKSIPETGWRERVSVRDDEGYIGRYSTGDSYLYIRIYVMKYMYAGGVGKPSVGNGGIVGARIKYQYPFIPEK